jgi:hypothetical protein
LEAVLLPPSPLPLETSKYQVIQSDSEESHAFSRTVII